MKKGQVLHRIGTFIDTTFSIVVYVLLLVIILFCVRQGHKYYHLAHEVFVQTSKDASGTGKSAAVEITEGMTVHDVGEVLRQAGLIDDAELFSWQEKFSVYSGKIQPGTYTLSSEMTANQMLAILSGAEASTVGSTGS